MEIINAEKTMEEIAAAIRARIEMEERRKEEEELRKAAELEKLQNMSVAEHIAYREGRPMPPSNEELASMSMEEYIKARQQR